MATRTFCDACNEELTGSISNKVEFRKHIVEKHNVSIMYSDSEGNPTSQASKTYDLCNRCYNRVMGVAYDKLLEIRGD